MPAILFGLLLFGDLKEIANVAMSPLFLFLCGFENHTNILFFVRQLIKHSYLQKLDKTI